MDLPLLDLGCGTGQLALRFLEAGYTFVGLDLSPHMLMMAENRCWRYVAAHKARFLQEDIRHFRIGTSFGMVLSTYNVLNHLDSEESVRGCLRSVRACLPAGAEFLFDFHTLKGLNDWVGKESNQWENEEIESIGEFDRTKGKALMRLKGRIDGRDFEQTIVNRAYPLSELSSWLIKEGFRQIRFSRMDDLQGSLEEPEMENRVLVVAG